MKYKLEKMRLKLEVIEKTGFLQKNLKQILKNKNFIELNKEKMIQ